MWTFPAGRVFGIPLRIHWSLPLFLVFELLRYPKEVHLTGPALILLFLSILIHELGHCFEARRLGAPARQILLWPLGGLAYTGQRQNAWEDIRVSLAGPVTHLPWIAICLAVLHFRGYPLGVQEVNPFHIPAIDPSNYWTALVQLVLWYQVVMFCLNLFVPAYPLDGGRILVSWMSTRWPPSTTAGTAIVITAIAAAVFISNGVVMLAVFILFEAAQLFVLLRAGQLEMHPLFHNAPRTAAPPPKPRHLRIVKSDPAPISGRVCPYCRKSLPEQAQMCGFCERMVPR